MKKSKANTDWLFTVDIAFYNKENALKILKDIQKNHPDQSYKLVMREISEWQDV